AGGQCEVLCIHGVHNVDRGQPLRHELCRVEIDHDLPVLSAVGRRERNAGNRGELLTQAIEAVVVKLLLVEIVGGQADLQDRNTRRIELDDDGGLNSVGHECADSICGGDDLRDGQIKIDIRLEVNFLDGNSVERLRLDVANAADAGADG